jgi:hypothetical protein
MEWEQEYGSLCSLMDAKPEWGNRVKQRDLMYDMIKWFDKWTVREGLAKAASRTKKAFPTVNEMVECINMADRKNLREEPQHRSCPYCQSDGTLKGTDLNWYRCVCKHAERFKKNFRLIPDEVMPAPVEQGAIPPPDVGKACMKVLMDGFRRKRSGEDLCADIDRILGQWRSGPADPERSGLGDPEGGVVNVSP